MHMSDDHRSGCPINLTLELLGDKWSLLILRDIIFDGKRHFREMLRSEEGIASNVLASRLKTLVDQKMLTKVGDPNYKRRAIYSLTEKAIALVPALAHIGAWGARWLPATDEARNLAQSLEQGGPPMWDRFITELRAEHLRVLRPIERVKSYRPREQPRILQIQGTITRRTTQRCRG
jgi:DNA-binding HxlR family transcriptional regulator